MLTDSYRGCNEIVEYRILLCEGFLREGKRKVGEDFLVLQINGFLRHLEEDYLSLGRSGR